MIKTVAGETLPPCRLSHWRPHRAPWTGGPPSRAASLPQTYGAQLFDLLTKYQNRFIYVFMKHHERILLPHAVYRLLDKGGTLLYVGFSASIWSRLNSHTVPSRSWYQEIATIRVEWHENELLARRAEARAILDEHPKYNSLLADPTSVGSHLFVGPSLPRPPRGDGVHCPKCGREKEKRTKPYCRACTAADQKERRLRRAAA